MGQYSLQRMESEAAAVVAGDKTLGMSRKQAGRGGRPAEGGLPIPAPGLLMIGAAGRNAGKTELACRIIADTTQAERSGPGDGMPGPCVTGVKVTTVQESGGLCPRGGQGCGVCATLESDWCISVEEDPHGPKDTSRLLRAGAARVFWLRVLEKSLAGGAGALLKQPGLVPPWVCESNRLRQVLDPDLFLLVRGASAESMKPSAASVAQLADAVVLSDGESFEPSEAAVSLLDGSWTLRRKATAIVLAGGRSTRMGTDKSLMALAGKPLVEHVVDQVRPQVEQIRLSAADEERFAFLGLPISRDRLADAGPLVAIASSLEDSTTEWNLVVPCDMPRIPARLVTQMFRLAEGADIVVPTSGGHFEPLLALYRRGCLSVMWEAIREGGRKIIDVFDRLTVRTLPLPSGAMLANLNTPDEVRRYSGE